MSACRVLLSLVLVGLSACARREEPPRSAAPVSAMSTGKRIFDNNCSACHQQNGAGIAGAFPRLAGSAVVRGDTAVLARWVILGRRPSSLAADRYPTQMPAFGWLKPDDAAALFTYLRASFGNTAPAVDAASVGAAISQ